MDVGERYVLGRLVGEGATARVYEAGDSVLRREVAVKVFRDPDVGQGGAERIDEEVRILAGLAHPFLLPVYDSGRDPDGHRFIVMPLVRGTTLAKRLVDGPVAPAEVKRIGAALAEALAHIHARGVVHRDVKPSNVLLADDGTPFLADFGFARAADGPALTATDCIVGTAGYLAPEQAEGVSMTPAVDVYALGLVLLEALTGERAYTGTPLERATANALRPPNIPARLGPGWLKVLRAMTARSPAARPTAGEVGALLDLGEDPLPGVTAVDDTVEVSMADPWRGEFSDSHSARSAVPGPVARAGGLGALRDHRRTFALGLAAVAVIGVGVGWLSSGTSTGTRAPVVTAPGNGAPGPQQMPTTSATRAPAAVADPGSAAGAVHSAPNQNLLATPTSAPASAKCPGGDGQNGNGHGKHKCHGGPGNGDH